MGRFQDDPEDMSEVLASVLSGNHAQQQPKRKKRLLLKSSKRLASWKARRAAKEDAWKTLDTKATVERAQYGRSVFGTPKKQMRKTKKQAGYHTIAIQVPAVNLKPVLERTHDYRRQLLTAAVVITSIILLFVGLRAYLAYRTNKEQASIDPNSLAPANVYSPRGLPPGYSVGSSSESLANGAVLYTIYDDKGRAITITQQSKPPGLDFSIFENALKFDSALGKAFILEVEDRITGYIFTDETMLLFNSTGGVNSTGLRRLMETYQP